MLSLLLLISLSLSLSLLRFAVIIVFIIVICTQWHSQDASLPGRACCYKMLPHQTAISKKNKLFEFFPIAKSKPFLTKHWGLTRTASNFSESNTWKCYEFVFHNWLVWGISKWCWVTCMRLENYDIFSLFWKASKNQKSNTCPTIIVKRSKNCKI